MRKILLLVAALLLVITGIIVASDLGSAAQAPAAASTSATTPQISVTGKLVVGKFAQAGVPVMLQFTAKNQSSSPYGPFFISFFVSSNASVVQIICTDNPKGSIVGGDLGNNTCEVPFVLGAHRNYKSAILVNANSDPPNLTVEACAGTSAGAKTFCNTQVVFLND